MDKGEAETTATAEAVGALLSSLGATGSLLCPSSHKKEKRQGKILGAFCRKEATRTPDPYVPNVVRYQLRYFPIEWCKDTGIFFIGEIYTLLFYDDVDDVFRLSGIVGDEQNAAAAFEIIAVVVYGDFQLLALAGFK